MKKYLLSLLLLSSFFLAPAREKNTAIETKPGIDSFSDRCAQNSELGLPSPVTTASPVNPVVKKITGNHELYVVSLTGYANHFGSIYQTTSLHSKDYLSHIHPSHHFW